MKPWVLDAAGPGIALWLGGYCASLVLFFTPFSGIMGWILCAVFTPVTILVTWWWFRKRKGLTLPYYAAIGAAWLLIAVVLDYLFIVQAFHPAAYYGPDVAVYYALTLLIPPLVGLFLLGERRAGISAGN